MTDIPHISEIDKNVGHALKLLRIEHGQEPKHLADILKLSVREIEKFEAGLKHIGPQILVQIAQHYGKTISYFFQHLTHLDRHPPKGRDDLRAPNADKNHDESVLERLLSAFSHLDKIDQEAMVQFAILSAHQSQKP